MDSTEATTTSTANPAEPAVSPSTGATPATSTQPEATPTSTAPVVESAATLTPAVEKQKESNTAEPAVLPSTGATPAPSTQPEATATSTAPVAAPASAPAPAAEKVKESEAEAEAEAEADVKEPENALTKKFTTAEWDALKSFRKELPEMLASAYTDKENAKTTPITLWGVRIDPANPQLDARVSVVLMKFLRARNLNPSAAKDMFVATLRWRDEFNVDAACKEEFPQDVFGQLGHIHGKDKEGRPVVYNIYGGNSNLNSVFGDVQRFLRWRVAFMEKSIELLDFETIDQMLQVHDYAGVSMASRDKNSKSAASEASSIFGSHYPELLHKKYFVNIPSYMTWIFWLFKPLIPAATLAKMSMVGTGASTIGKTLLVEIDAKELPERYGGEAEAF